MWKHPWQLEKFDNIYNKDERFFSIHGFQYVQQLVDVMDKEGVKEV